MNAASPASTVAESPTISLQYRDVQASPALTQLIQTEIQRLARHHRGLTHCRVTVARPHQHHQHGRLFEVALELTTGLGHIVVNHHPPARALQEGQGEVHASRTAEVEAAHSSAYVTIRDVFDIARRKLDEQSRRVRTHRHRDEADPLSA